MRWQKEKAEAPRNICTTCDKELNKNNVSGYCRQHYIYKTSKEYKRKHNNKWYLKSGAKYYKDRYINDIGFKLSSILRARLLAAIKNNQKSGSAVRDLGCSIPELKKHLESQFQPGMSWENWSKDGWHIDHVVPLSNFDLTNPEEIKKACHYSNLQPLWAFDNLSKGSTIN